MDPRGAKGARVKLRIAVARIVRLNQRCGPPAKPASGMSQCPSRHARNLCGSRLCKKPQALLRFFDSICTRLWSPPLVVRCEWL